MILQIPSFYFVTKLKLENDTLVDLQDLHYELASNLVRHSDLNCINGVLYKVRKLLATNHHQNLQHWRNFTAPLWGHMLEYQRHIIALYQYHLERALTRCCGYFLKRKVCRQIKYLLTCPYSLPQPIQAPLQVWEDVTIDFSLTSFNWHTVIMVNCITINTYSIIQ